VPRRRRDGLVVAAWGRHGQEHRRVARHAADSGSGSREDESADAQGCLVGELLRNDTAEGHPEHVDLFVAETVEHSFHGPGHAWHALRLPVAR
jgi:hypothetical protein